jgi:hypothetical protein
MDELARRVGLAVSHFWQVRYSQAEKQGAGAGAKDPGLRSAVTGGKHLDGFVSLCRSLLVEAGLPDAAILHKARLELPGYYRPEKRWDLLVVIDDVLVAVAEFKAQVGPSFGNNFNNRTEEAVGNATDLWAAYREGAFQPSQRPWLGYVFLLEDCPKSTAAVTVQEPHFHVFPEFRDASYAKRYEILLTKLIRERLYDATCLIMSTAAAGLQGEYREPSEELGFARFAASFTAHAISYAKAKERPKRPKQKPRDTD